MHNLKASRKARRPNHPRRLDLSGSGLLGAGALLAVLSDAPCARAWTVNEHVRITHVALKGSSPADGETGYFLGAVPDPGSQSLAAEEARVLAELWEVARVGHGDLCADIAQDMAKNASSTCMAFSGFPAIAADHSCAPCELDAAVRQSWTREVVREGFAFDRRAQKILRDQHCVSLEDLQCDLPTARVDIQGVRLEMDIQLLTVDKNYVSRAQDNTSHFQLVRRTAETLPSYLIRALSRGTRSNAASLYALYHASALRYAALTSAPEQSGTHDLAWRALLNEAYAIHFLEDAFSTGHMVGGAERTDTEGLRLGTHDYYSSGGLSVVTWNGYSYGAYGDGFARSADYTAAAAAVRESLRQVAHAALGRLASTDIDTLNAPALAPLDSCGSADVPEDLTMLARSTLLQNVWMWTPKPSVDRPPLPQFHSEKDPFGSLSILVAAGGLAATSGEKAAFVADTLVMGGLGIGLEGVTSRHFDGLAFGGAVVGVRMLGDNQRMTYGFRARVPFAWVPGDAAVWLPVLLLTTRKSAVPCAVSASYKAMEGSRPLLLVPWNWELTFNERTSFRFDFGREVVVVWSRSPEDGFAYRGWDVTVPYANFRTHIFSNPIAQDDMFGLSFRAGRDDALGYHLGLNVTYSRIARYYPAWFD